MAVTIIEDRCPQDHPCPAVNICPVHALHQDGNRAPSVDKTLCTECGKCIKTCPMGVFSLK